MLARGYPAGVPRVGHVIVDFDGTICLHDVGVDLLERFGELRRFLETDTSPPGPAGGESCPGWREAT